MMAETKTTFFQFMTLCACDNRDQAYIPEKNLKGSWMVWPPQHNVDGRSDSFVPKKGKLLNDPHIIIEFANMYIPQYNLK